MVASRVLRRIALRREVGWPAYLCFLARDARVLDVLVVVEVVVVVELVVVVGLGAPVVEPGAAAAGGLPIASFVHWVIPGTFGAWRPA